ncbi:ATP-binding protein [Thiolapillus sp.]
MEVSLLDRITLVVVESKWDGQALNSMLCSYGLQTIAVGDNNILDLDSQLNGNNETIVVADLQAQGIDCLGIIKQLKNIQRHIPVILIADFNNRDLIQTVTGLNLGHYVPTPVDEYRLMAEVGKCAEYLWERTERERMVAEEKVIGLLLQLSLQHLDMHEFLQSSLETLFNEITWLSLEQEGAVFLVREEGGGPCLSLAAEYQFSPELHVLCDRIEFGQCFCGRAAESGEIQFSSCIDHHHEIHYEGMQPHGHYSVPLLHDGKVLGVVVFYVPQGHSQLSTEAAFLQRVADTLSMGIIRRVQLEEIKEAESNAASAVEQLDGITENLSSIIFRRIEYPDGHIEYPYVSKSNTGMKYFPSHKLAEGFFEGFEMVHEDDRKTVMDAMHRAGKLMKPMKIDFRFLLENGGSKWLHCGVHPRYQESGAICWDGLILDIEDRKSLETQLVQSQKLEAVGQLAAGIAHEINTPTQYVSDNTHFLKEAMEDYGKLINEYRKLIQAGRQGAVSEELIDGIVEMEEDIDLEYISEEVPTAIEQALEGLQKIATIVRAMKEFSHPGSEEMESINVNQLLENTIIISRNEWKYVAKIETDLQPDLPPIMGYPNQLSQVFLNMIVNASHAIAGIGGEKREVDGRITISTRMDGGCLVAHISDNGPGIPAELRDKVFNPFFTTKEVGKGTGQGLAIAHDIVAGKHHGSLVLEQSPEGGAAFVISLPAVVEATAQLQNEAAVVGATP